MSNTARNKGVLIFTLAILSLIAFSACSAAGTASTDSAVKTTGSTSTASTSEVSNIAPSIETGATQVSTDVENLLANQDLLNEIVAKGDVAGCKGLNMTQFQVSCETNILSNKAKSNADLIVCDTASTAEIKTHCQDLVAKKQF